MVNSEFRRDDIDEASLRPRTINEYIGQSKVKENLLVFIEAAQKEKKLWIMYFLRASRTW